MTVVLLAALLTLPIQASDADSTLFPGAKADTVAVPANTGQRLTCFAAGAGAGVDTLDIEDGTSSMIRTAFSGTIGTNRSSIPSTTSGGKTFPTAPSSAWRIPSAGSPARTKARYSPVSASAADATTTAAICLTRKGRRYAVPSTDASAFQCPAGATDNWWWSATPTGWRPITAT